MAEPYYPKSPEELLSPKQVMSMSGLAYMQGLLNGEFPAAPIARAMGYRLVSVAKGGATFRGAPTFEHCNPMGSVHGGWYGTLLDSAMGCAVMTKLEQGTGYTTLEYKVNIVRSIPLGTEIDAIATVNHMGRSTGVAEGRIVGVEDGKLYATATTTCIVLRPSS